MGLSDGECRTFAAAALTLLPSLRLPSLRYPRLLWGLVPAAWWTPIDCCVFHVAGVGGRAGVLLCVLAPTGAAARSSVGRREQFLVWMKPPKHD